MSGPKRTAWRPAAPAPYPGMRPFRRDAEVDESGIFFGREAHTFELINRLSENGFVAVIGPSGSGKSSLVRVGLVQKLLTGYLHRAGGRWAVAAFAPGAQPIEALKDAVSSSLAEYEATAGTGPDAVGSLLENTSGLVDLACTVLAQPEAPNLLVVADQFEEVFQHSPTDQRVELINTLLYAFNRRTDKLFVMLTMRTDSLERCAAYQGLPEALNRTAFLVPRLNIAEVEDAVTKPARVFGTSVGPRLADRLLTIMDTPGDYDPDALPLLQHALRWLWEESPEPGAPLTLERLEELIGAPVSDHDMRLLREALTAHADQLFATLSEPQQRAVRALCMLGRVTDENGNEHRRRTTLSEVRSVAGVSDADVDKAIEVFTDPRWSLFRWVDRPRRLEVSHEALLRNWGRLRRWADQEDQDVIRLRQLSSNATDYATGRLSPLGGSALRRTRHWWTSKRSPDEGWAGRHGVDPAPIDRYVAESSRRSRNSHLRWGGLGLLTALTLGSTIVLFVNNKITERRNELEDERAAAEAADQLARVQAAQVLELEKNQLLLNDQTRQAIAARDSARSARDSARTARVQAEQSLSRANESIGFICDLLQGVALTRASLPEDRRVELAEFLASVGTINTRVSGTDDPGSCGDVMDIGTGALLLRPWQVGNAVSRGAKAPGGGGDP